MKRKFIPGIVLIIIILVALVGAGLHRWRVGHPHLTTNITVGSSAQAITVNGIQRTYRLYVPAGLNDAVPLVVMLHGGGGSGKQAESSYGWDSQADSGHFIVAYPDGLNHAWNAGGNCCGQPVKNNVDDVGFITAMIQKIEQQASINPHRIYVTGISNGGIMSYHLACQTKDIFAAIGPDSATMLDPCPHPQPISVIHIHGTADQNILYNGGDAMTGSQHIDGPPIPALNAQWRQIDNCSQPTITTSSVVTTSIATCADSRAVELITIDGAGHQWPGGAPKSRIQQLRGSDPPSTALNATATIWQFFAAHPKQ